VGRSSLRCDRPRPWRLRRWPRSAQRFPRALALIGSFCPVGQTGDASWMRGVTAPRRDAPRRLHGQIFKFVPRRGTGFPTCPRKMTGSRGAELSRHANFGRVGAALHAHVVFTDKFSNLSHVVGRVSQPVREKIRLSVIRVEPACELLSGWGCTARSRLFHGQVFKLVPRRGTGFPTCPRKITGSRGSELSRHANFCRVGAALPAHVFFTDKFSNLSHVVRRVSQPVREK
jgi:hypothetical protein